MKNNCKSDKQYILSLSYGKDSMACLGAIDELGWKLDRIVHAEIWATDEIHADLPDMVNFKKKADKIIKNRWGIEVEHFRSKYTYNDCFYFKRGRTGRKSKFNGKIYGFPMVRGQWCLQQLKQPVLNKFNNKNNIVYIGIAIDEPKRFNNLSDTKKSPLVEIGWSEDDCRKWCESNDLLSPIYTTSSRGGCWFCHNQSIEQLRILRKNYPKYWEMMLKWDEDSPVTFKPDGHTVHDLENRFYLEDKGDVPKDRKFRWYNINKQLELF